MRDGKSKFKIAIVGIGGVGGFIGGRLTAHFHGSGAVEVILAARGANEKAIREKGLKLVTTAGEQIVRPTLAAIDELGEPDLLILCTKEYDLEETVVSLRRAIGARTAIMPLLNGVEARERIASMLPSADVWHGCIYIISRLAAPGVVEETGNICRIYFGDGKAAREKTQAVEAFFQQAGIDANWSADSEARIWEKFVFLSPLAAATSFLDVRTRELMDNPRFKKLFDELLAEIKALARAKNVAVDEETIQNSVAKLKNVPPAATSSMHADFSRGSRAELHSLVGYVVREARALNVAVPVYEKVYAELVKKLEHATQEGKR